MALETGVGLCVVGRDTRVPALHWVAQLTTKDAPMPNGVGDCLQLLLYGDTENEHPLDMYISLCKRAGMETFSTFADLQAKHPISFDANVIIKEMGKWWGKVHTQEDSNMKIMTFNDAVSAARKPAPAP